MAGSASAWKSGGSGLIWSLRLRTGIDGLALRDRWASLPAARDDLVSVEVTPDSLRVRFARPTDSVPSVLADPIFATRVAVGSRPTVRLVRVAADLRDWLGPAARTRVDLLFTRDSRALDYARSRSEWQVVPLPYDRAYVLLSAAPTGGFTSAGADLLDAVGTDARPADPPAWWGSSRCAEPTTPRAGTPRAEVLYPIGDPTARSLASRIVALAGRSDPPPWLAGRLGGAGGRLVAVAADSGTLRTAIRTGTRLLVVAADPVAVSLGCPEAPWSTGAGARAVLLETRGYLVVRRGIGPLAIDRAGGVRVHPGESP